jgi:hypothetical protein
LLPWSQGLHGHEFAEPGVVPVAQLLVGARFHQPALVEDVDVVDVADGGQAVRDDDDGGLALEGVDAALDEALGFGVEGAGGLVQDEQVGLAEELAGDEQALALAA